MNGEMQKEAIKTIKPREITLNLSDEDVNRIRREAASVGITVAELLENFIWDLVDGTYSNGSDERDRAEEWFERCGFAMLAENNFLQYLIQEGYWGVEEVLNYHENITINQEIIERAKTEIEKGIIERCGKTYHWFDCKGMNGNQLYATYEEWKADQLKEIAGLEEEIEEYRAEINSCWKEFLEWTDMPAEDLKLEEEIKKIEEWKKRSESELIEK